MRAVVYSRVSTEEQVAGYSLDKQEEECIKFIKNAGYTYVDSYIDDGYSAKDTNRPALQRMLTAIPRREFDMIVVWNSDRLSRDVIDGLTIVKTQFNKYGIKFASVTEDIDTSTPDGMMMFTMRLMFAQRERERIAERVTMGLSRKASTGRRVNFKPILGYDIVEGDLVVNEEEAEIVRKIFDLFVNKLYGQDKIAKALQLEGYSTKQDVGWHGKTIKHIIRNRTYIGYNVWTPKRGDPIIVRGNHDPIIDEGLFEQAQRIIYRKAHREMTQSSKAHPFTTIVKCGECGSPFTMSRQNKYAGKSGDIWHMQYSCVNKKFARCSLPTISERKIEQLVFQYFKSLHLRTESFEPEPMQNEAKDAEKEKARIEREIKKLEKRKSTLLDNLGDGIISRDDYKMKVAEITESLNRLNQEMDLIQPPEVAAARSPNEIIDFVKNLEEDWPYMEPEHKKLIMQSLFKKIVIGKKDDEWSIMQIEPA